MLRFIHYFNFLFLSFALSGQTFDEFKYNYNPLYSQGPLPADLSITAFDKATNALNYLDKKDPSYKVRKEYFMNTIFDEDKLLKGGSLVFNSRVNTYINSIADIILKENKALRDELNFFVTRENHANAWAFDNGHIYISLDYIARYNTEAQLAMTLCHEIAHFVNKHHYKRYLKRAEILKNMKRTYDQDTIRKKERNFYKLQESQADLEGFELFLKTPYSVKTIPDKYDMMLLCDYSFENTPFDVTYFNNGDFIINPKIFYQEVKPIHIDANYDDSWDTHPNIYKRKKMIEEAIANSKKTEGKDFVIGENEFYYLRDVARFETIKTNLQEFNPVEAFYHTYCLLKKYPENNFLNHVAASVLYQMAIFKSYSNIHGGFYDYLFTSDNVKVNANRDSTMGNIAQIKKMFNRLNGEDFVLLSINHNYKMLKQSDFKDHEYKIMLDTLFDVLHNIHNLSYKDFYKRKEQIIKTYKDSLLSLNRKFVDAIDQKSAFLNYINENSFQSFFKDTVSVNEFGLKYILKGKTKKFTSAKTNNPLLGRTKHIQSNKNEILLVKRIVLLEPRFEKTVYKKYQVEDYPFDAYDNSLYFKEELKKTFSEKNIEYIELGDSKFSIDEVKKYNNLALTNSIISENDQHYDIPSVGVFNSKSEGTLISDYNTPYYLQVCVYENNYENVKFIINGMPFEKDIKTFTYCFDLVNIETGISIYRHSFDANYELNRSAIRDQVYIDVNNIITLKTKP